MIKQKEGESVCRFIHAADADILSKEKSGPTGARTAGPIRYGTRPIRKKRSTGAYRESSIRSALLHEENDDCPVLCYDRKDPQGIRQ